MLNRIISSNLHKEVLKLVPVFLLITLGLVAINLVWLIPTFNNIRSSTSFFTLEVAERASSDIKFILSNAKKQLVDAAEDVVFEPSESGVILRKLLKRSSALRSVAVVSREGKETFRLDRLKIVQEADLLNHSLEPQFYTALKGVSSFGEVFLSPESEPFVTIYVPILNITGGVEEILIADLNLRSLISTVSTFRIGGGHIYVVDRDGFQIIHPDLGEIVRRPNFYKRSIVQQVVVNKRLANGLSPEDSYLNDRGEEVFVVGVPISVTGWGLFVEQPKKQALIAERQAIFFAAATVGLGILILLLVIVSNVRLERLNLSLRELLQERDLSAKLLVRRDQELVFTNVNLRRLNEEFNDVAKMLVRRDLELTEANTRLQELDVVKSEFVSVAAHQLRTPLTGIRWSYVAILEDTGGVLSMEQRKIAEEGLKAVLRAIQVIDALLNVARIEEGRFGFNFQHQYIVPLVEEAFNRFRGRAKDKGVSVSLALPKSKLTILKMDSDKIGIALDNLLDNALKYTNPGGKIAVKVSLEKNDFKFEIKDTGIGIPESQRHRVFTKFFRADNAILVYTSGGGLGLYTVKNIIEKHNGNITFESEEGKGTKFIFTLPMKS